MRHPQMRQGRGLGALGGAQRTIGLTSSLRSLAAQVAAEEHKKEMDARRAKANKPDGRIGRRVRFSDEEVAEMRRLHQKGGWTTTQLAEKYEVNRHWMHEVLTYAIRARHVYA